MNFKRLTAVALSGVLAASVLGGCGIDKDATVAVMGDTEIKLGIANFLARYQQAGYSDYLSYMSSYYGYEDVWQEDLYGSGETMEESIKSSTMEMLHEYYTLKAHMSDYNVELTDEQTKTIEETATTFMESNSEEALKELGATQEIVEEVLTLFTIQHEMYDAIVADVDTNVSDEEANMRAYSMITIATDTHYDEEYNSVEYTEDEVNQLKASATAFVAQAAGSTDEEYAALAEEYGYSPTDGTYDADDEELDTDVKNALDALKEGEDAVMVTTDTDIYIVKITAETDEEATETNRETIVTERQDEEYNSVLEGWQEDDGWEIKEKVWAKVTFDDYFTTTSESTETEAGTEVEGTEVEGTEVEGTETEGTETESTEESTETEGTENETTTEE